MIRWPFVPMKKIPINPHNLFNAHLKSKDADDHDYKITTNTKWTKRAKNLSHKFLLFVAATIIVVDVMVCCRFFVFDGNSATQINKIEQVESAIQ